MVNLVLSPEQLVSTAGEKLKTDSRKVAKAFNKRHHHIMRDIRYIISKIPLELRLSIFGEVSEFDHKANKSIQYYEMSRDGFMLLVMGFTGEKAFQVKLSFIQAFNYMESQLDKFSLYKKLVHQRDVEKSSASDCGRGLNAWKARKHWFDSEIPKLHQSIQPDLFISAA